MTRGFHWTGDRSLLPLCVLVGLVAWSVYAWSSRPWFPAGDAAWLSDAARHFAEGKGLTTSATLPAYLAVGERTAVDLNPQYQTPPGYPVLLGLIFKLGFPPELATLTLQGSLHVVLVVLTYLTARQFLSPSGAALAAVVVGVEPGMLEHAVEADIYSLFAVASLGTCALLLGARVDRRHVVFGGVLLAATQLVRFNAGSLVPAYAALVLAGPAGRSRAAMFVAAWSVSSVLLLLLTGSTATEISGSASLLLETKSYPGLSIQGVLRVPGLFEALTTYGIEIAAKGIAGLRFYMHELPAVGDPLLVGGVVVAGLSLSGLPRARPLIAFTFLATLITVSVASLIHFNIGLLHFILPLYVILVVWALERSVTVPRLAPLVVLVLSLAMYTGETARVARDSVLRAHEAAALERLAVALTTDSPADEWVATDIPATLTWLSRLSTVRLPNRPEDLPAIEALRRPLSRVVVTTVAVNARSRYYPDDAWQRVLETRLLDGFALEGVVDEGRVKAVIFRKVTTRAARMTFGSTRARVSS